MTGLLRILLCLGAFIVLFAVATVMELAYEWIRRKYNAPHYGFEYFLLKKLKRDDYVSIDGRVMRFDHIARYGESIDCIAPPLNDNMLLGGELAFRTSGLNYLYYFPSALTKCDFIWGKYGLKWASSKQMGEEAEKHIKKAGYHI